jgi:hypothetical protein
MFVEASAPVPLSIEAARVALIAALANHDLVQESNRAYAEGLTSVHQVEARRLSKRVRVRTLPSHDVGQTTVVPIRWEATGLSGDLFPALDADLCLTPVNEVTSLLSLIGRYAPPLGAVGTVIDRTVLSGTAQVSVDTFLRGLSTAMRDRRGTGADRR